MSKDPLQPGQTFHLPAAQQANMTSLLKVLGSKKATAALTELGKTKDSTWGSIENSISGLNDFIRIGGTAKILESLKETVDLQITAALSPLTNEFKQIIADALAPAEVLMQEISNNLSAFVINNEKGALVGAMAGQLAAMFLPGGPILVVLGALIGSTVQAIMDFFAPGSPYWEDFKQELRENLFPGERGPPGPEEEVAIYGAPGHPGWDPPGYY